MAEPALHQFPMGEGGGGIISTITTMATNSIKSAMRAVKKAIGETQGPLRRVDNLTMQDAYWMGTLCLLFLYVVQWLIDRGLTGIIGMESFGGLALLVLVGLTTLYIYGCSLWFGYFPGTWISLMVFLSSLLGILLALITHGRRLDFYMPPLPLLPFGLVFSAAYILKNHEYMLKSRGRLLIWIFLPSILVYLTVGVVRGMSSAFMAYTCSLFFVAFVDVQRKLDPMNYTWPNALQWTTVLVLSLTDQILFLLMAKKL